MVKKDTFTTHKLGFLEKITNAFFDFYNSRRREIFRFIIAGVITAMINLGILYTLSSILGLWYILAVVVTFIVGTAVSFVMQKFWAFSHYSLKKTHREIFWYTINSVGGLLFNVIALYVLVEYFDIWYISAQFFLLIVLAVWNFFAYRFLIFTHLGESIKQPDTK